MRPAMAAWFADPAARRAARRRTDDCAARFAASPEVARFTEAIADTDDAGRVAAAIDRLFADSQWREDLIGALIEEAAADPFFMPPHRGIASAIHDALLLIDRPEAAVALAIVSPDRLAAHKRSGEGRGSVNFSGRRVMLRFIRAGRARLSIWDAPPAGDGFRSGAAGRCRRTAFREMADGDRLDLDTARQTYIFESVAAPAIFLQGEIRVGAAAVAREYDAAGGAFLGASGGRESDARIQMMLSFLRACGRREAARYCARFAQTGPFYLRWYAMREWLALDAAGAWPALAEMARGDPHPDVRAAARAVIDRPPAGRSNAA